MRLSTTKKEIENQILADVKSSGVFANHSFSPLSKIFTLIRALANAIYLFLDSNLGTLQKAIHPHTAEETDLHEWLKRYGMSWKQAVAARHIVKIGHTSPILWDVEIPQGQIVTTDGTEKARIRFFTTDAVTLQTGTPINNDGYYTVSVMVECEKTGSAGNVVKDGISLIEDSPDEQLSIVYNPALSPARAGSPRETISQVRARLQTAENAMEAMWTPSWYSKQVEMHPNVARAIFKSSRALGIPGLIKIMVLGRSGIVSPQEVTDIMTDLESDPKNPGGVARVTIENFISILINKTITVQFPNLESIPSQSVLDEVIDRYFTAIGDGVDIQDAALKTIFLNVPFAVNVLIFPPGDIAINENQVAIPGQNFHVIGEVFEQQ